MEIEKGLVIMTRKEAREKGLKFFYSHKVCPHGHRTYRYCSTSWCLDCARAIPKERIAIRNAIQRCTNPKNPAYKNYGAKGVKVAKGWIDDWRNFLADVGPKPEGTSLDRIDPTGDYNPTNASWRSPHVQAYNKRNTVWVTVDERRICLRHASRSVGVSEASIKQRARKIAATLGIDFAPHRTELLELALEYYKQYGKGHSATARGKRVTVNGALLTVREAAAVLGVTVNAIRSRMWRRRIDAQTAVDHYARRGH
jgi:hypothetical protein